MLCVCVCVAYHYEPLLFKRFTSSHTVCYVVILDILKCHHTHIPVGDWHISRRSIRHGHQCVVDCGLGLCFVFEIWNEIKMIKSFYPAIDEPLINDGEQDTRHKCVEYKQMMNSFKQHCFFQQQLIKVNSNLPPLTKKWSVQTTTTCCSYFESIFFSI